MPVDTGIYSGLLAPPRSSLDYANQYADLGLLPLKRQLMESQVQDALSNNQLRAAQVQMMQRKQSMIEGLLNPQSSPAPSGPNPMDVGQAAMTQVAKTPSTPGQWGANGYVPPTQTVGPTTTAAALQSSALANLPPAPTPPSPYGGLDPRMVGYDVAFNDGKGLAGYLNDRTKPTPEQLNANYAFPNDPNAARAAVQAAVSKAGYIPPVNARPGSILRDPRTNLPLAFNPHVPDGYAPTFDASGNVVSIVPIAGATPAMISNAQAGSLGKSLGEIRSGVDANNMPTYVTGLPPGTVVGGGSLAGGYPTVAPNAAGRPGVPAQAQASMDADAKTLLNQELAKATQSLLTATAAGDSAGAARARGDIDALHKELALRGAPAPASAAVLPSQQPVVRPGLQAGQADYANTVAKAAGDRANEVISLAKDSPTRINVLDNIINLSKQGVATGPTQDFQNQITGYLGDALNIPSFQSKVSNYQEINKFLQQNGIRAWQAAGGTGTDAQLAQNMTANPNSKMFPQAIQAMANWAKAGELAAQSKATALQVANPTTPQAQTDFENKWRQAFDPRAFQMLTMTPQERANFVAKQSDAAALKLKIQQLSQLGAF